MDTAQLKSKGASDGDALFRQVAAGTRVSNESRLRINYRPLGVSPEEAMVPQKPINPHTIYSDYAANAASSGASYPFDVLVQSSTTYKLRAGTINGYTPSNMGNTFTMAGSGTEYCILTVTVTNGVITGAVISNTSSVPAAMPVNQGQPPTSFVVLLAVLVNGSPFRTIAQGSVGAKGYEVYRLAKSMPTPDALPYDSYYSWLLSAA